ncbi:hypothetical protein FA95DRAFT_1414494 [Auriscalpium vulgare]|uniref:Uncharacterized protein n=1 Tax=Auriscalpium vulgare TaxID=40419 RepID=A0ACB8RQN8_9AGAM|nr:hypothetical protein FA95DRAFT_1414494 [Auriscalpium vulgare]
MPRRAHAQSLEAVVAPVARLPPEILSLVFSILSSIDPPHPTLFEPFKLKNDLGWLVVTHVCRRWRNIALNDPALWASDIALPSVMGDRWAAEFLSRAQGLPLTLTWCHELSSVGPGSLSDTPFIGANLARMCAIMDLRTYPHHLRALCTPAPLLHTLYVGIYHGQKAKLPYSPDSLFGGAAGLPKLRHLHVFAWAPQAWTPLLLEQLVSVDMTMCQLDLPGAAVASIFAALGRMRALERLALMLGMADADGVPVTTLPVLQHLSLRVSVRDARLLLARLVLPAGVRVRFTLVQAAEELSTVFPAMISCVGARAPIVRVAVQLAAPDMQFPLTKYFNFAEVGAWRSGDTEGAPALAARVEDWEDVPSVLGSIQSTHLEVLTIGYGVRDAAWLDLLGSAPRLRHVTVKGAAVPPFCAALERAPGVLPALSTLVVNVQRHPRARSSLLDALPRCLVSRNALRELEVVGCDEDEACARALQETVPSLVIRWRKAESEEEDEVYEEEDDGDDSEDTSTSDSSSLFELDDVDEQ